MNPQLLKQEPLAFSHVDKKDFTFNAFANHSPEHEPFTERQEIMDKLAAFRNLVKENIPNSLCHYTIQLLQLAMNTQNIMSNYYWVNVDWPTMIEFPQKHHYKMCDTCRTLYMEGIPLIFKN